MITVVVQTKTEISRFHSDATGMAYAYLHWSKVDQCNYEIKSILALVTDYSYLSKHEIVMVQGNLHVSCYSVDISIKYISAITPLIPQSFHISCTPVFCPNYTLDRMLTGNTTPIAADSTTEVKALK